jgi:hypothetical protein
MARMGSAFITATARVVRSSVARSASGRPSSPSMRAPAASRALSDAIDCSA